MQKFSKISDRVSGIVNRVLDRIGLKNSFIE